MSWRNEDIVCQHKKRDDSDKGGGNGNQKWIEDHMGVFIAADHITVGFVENITRLMQPVRMMTLIHNTNTEHTIQDRWNQYNRRY